MKEQILKLKSEGKRTCDIARELNITTQSISYHLNPSIKERHLAMQRKARAAAREERLANPKPKKQPVKKEKPQPMKTDRVKKVQKLQQKKELAKFKTVAVDNSEKVAVKLDHKTTVYARPGYDIDALRAKYLPR